MTNNKGDREPDTRDFIGGTLNILGLKLDLGDLLASPESLRGRLEELRERLKAAGGTEVLTDEQWRQGASISGSIRTRGALGDREYHVGTTGRPQPQGPRRRPASVAPSRPTQPEAPEVVEPPIDVFDDADGVTIVADVPGASLDDFELKLDDGLFSLTSKPTARRRYRKEIPLEGDLEPASLRATCRNGVLEVRIARGGAKKAQRGSRKRAEHPAQGDD